VCFTKTLAETHSKSNPVQSPLYRTELPTQAIQELRINVKTDDGRTRLLQYKHFYQRMTKAIRKGIEGLVLMIKSVKNSLSQMIAPAAVQENSS